LHTPKLSVLSEEGGTPAEPVANLTAVAAVTQEFEETADKSRVVPATSTQTPAQAVKNDLTASPMSVLRADAAIPDRVTTLPLDTSVRLSGTESSRLAPPVDAEPVNPVMPEITENRKAQVVTGLAGELLKDSPGVAHSRLGSPVGQLKVTTTSETPYDEQVLAGLPIKSASDSTALPVHTAPLASSVTPFSNVQQLEAVGRLRTLLNQTVPVQDETPALQANTARVTSVAVEGGKTQIPADAAQLVTSTVSPNPEVHSRSGEQSVSPQVNVNPLGQAMPEKLMSETVGALVTPVAADLKALPVSAGEFMVAQAVSTNGLQPTATTAVTGTTAMATPVAIQDPEMPVRLGGQLRLMVEGGVQSASLQVKPAELGPIQISLLSDNDRLTVNIMAGNAVTRDLLDSALPRLREQLGQGQFNQIDVNISDSGKGQQQSGAGFGNDASFYQAEQEVAQRENSDSQASSDEAPDDESAPDNSEKTVARNPVSSDGRIDAYI
ncbi:MAG: flagellar hook-length control protein FliK, partial [Granulosicoccus sp.]|nr:flagellar hook-length control protein FliK [Granulosicoccus sp.]